MTEETDARRARIPRDPVNDYTADAAGRRRAFVEAETGAKLDHVGRHSSIRQFYRATSRISSAWRRCPSG